MGADGGVAWVKLRTPELQDPFKPYHTRFLELVRPFMFDFFNDYHVENDRYIVENFKTGHLYSTFGTDQDVGGYCALDEVLRELGYTFDDKEWSFFESLGLAQTASFNDLLMAYHTSPISLEVPCETLRYLLRAIGYPRRQRWGTATENDDWATSVVTRALENSIFAMPVRKWYEEVMALVEPKSFGNCETWT